MTDPSPVDDDPNANLDEAYNLETSAEAKRLYDRWAATYESEYVRSSGYQFPGMIAAAYVQHAGPGDVPVLDVGAGPGNGGSILAEIAGPAMPPLDALDISPQMLVTCAAKGCYRNTVEADLLQTLPIETGAYGGIISAGTFTHGHVGPVALDELLRIGQPGALYILGMNALHYAHQFFDIWFGDHDADGSITGFWLETVAMFDAAIEGGGHDHSDAEGHIVHFRKAI